MYTNMFYEKSAFLPTSRIGRDPLFVGFCVVFRNKRNIYICICICRCDLNCFFLLLHYRMSNRLRNDLLALLMLHERTRMRSAIDVLSGKYVAKKEW